MRTDVSKGWEEQIVDTYFREHIYSSTMSLRTIQPNVLKVAEEIAKDDAPQNVINKLLLILKGSSKNTANRN